MKITVAIFILLAVAACFLFLSACGKPYTNEDERQRVYDERKAAGYPDPGSDSGSFTGWGNH